MFSDNSPRKRFRSSGIAAVSAVALSVSGANAATVPDYMIITGSDKISGHALNMSNSELGAIGSNSSTSEPGSLPSLPGKSVRSVADGIYLDGDAAILGNGMPEARGQSFSCLWVTIVLACHVS